MNKNKLALAIGAAVLNIGTATSVSAQQSEPSAAGTSRPLETVVVVAQRRTQDAQDVGISISVLDSNDMATAGFTSSTAIADFVPGVHMGGSLAGQSFQFAIRGVAQNDYSDSIEGPVAVYVDDAYIPSQQGQTLAMFDLARVEVLKGPQGTLFGRNATGGLVNFIVNTPTEELEGNATISGGNLGQKKFEGAVSGPLTDNLLGRASFVYDHLDNYWDNKFPAGAAPNLPTQFGPPLDSCCDDEGGFELYAGRVQLQYNVSELLSLRLVGAASSRKLSTAPYTSVATTPIVNENGSVINTIRTSPTDTRTIIGPDGENYFNPELFPLQGAQTGIGYGPAPGLRFPGNTWFGYDPLDPDNSKLSKQYADDNANKDSTSSLTLHVDYEFDSMSFTSVTNYMDLNKLLMMDAAGTPQNLNQYGTDADIESYSQEFRLNGETDKIRWLLGAYYLHIDSHVKDGLLAATGSLLAGAYDMPLTGVDPLADRTLKTNSYSLFGQLEYDFLPKWTVIMGLRGVQEKQDYNLEYYAAENTHDYKIDSAIRLYPLPYAPYDDDRTENMWAGKFQLEYRPVDTMLLFAGVNRGVKAGNYNAKIYDFTPNVPASDIPYDPEVLISYEGGFKWTPDNMPLSLNGMVFHYDYNDYQAFLFTNNTGVVYNVDADTDGMELELNARLGEDLDLSIAYAYTDAKIPDFGIAPGVFRDVRPTFTSKDSAAMQLRYRVPGTLMGGRMELAGSVTYSSSFYDNLRNFSSDKLDGRTLGNADVSWRSSDEKWQVSAYVKNLTDETYATVGFNSAANCGCSIEAYGLPRTYGLALGVSF